MLVEAKTFFSLALAHDSNLKVTSHRWLKFFFSLGLSNLVTLLFHSPSFLRFPFCRSTFLDLSERK